MSNNAPTQPTEKLAPVTRRELLRSSLALGAVASLGTYTAAAQPDGPALRERPALKDRRFTSPAVESAIIAVAKQIDDPELALIFSNCLPNTLDTTVTPGTFEGKPDTFVITGDIDAMWLRDSSAQVYPYLQFCRADRKLATLIEGVIHRQARCILLDPYANAFLPSPASKPLSWSTTDDTTMKPGVGERKWEIDSLCYTIRLAHGYWKATGNTAPFDAQWCEAMRTVVQTFRVQQRKDGPGPYHFQRTANNPTDTMMLSGYGSPGKPNGLIHSGFRPSDDACLLPFFIPANLFAVASLRQLAELASAACHDTTLAQSAHGLADEVSAAIAKNGIIDSPESGRIWAYEVDGFGGRNLMDDANAPGLLSLAYLNCVDPSDRDLYQRTRAFALSTANPYFFQGTAGEGIGGPHIGLGYIWPMSIIQRAFSATSDAEISEALRTLRNCTAGTHFMHESFWKDDPAKYTRTWFAWANTLFGELIVTLAKSRPALLRQSFAPPQRAQGAASR
ncbi:glycoside hydrolase family 125 protein [Acidipila sp. EB88]|uniref:glycoside hydrolase family 125 protein n=1 Tax=Acidipila sp. EB88 TaxID=2305226 RepID=UPI000F5ED2E7|nr:glycoside hydrolase family 125 protein [Acidipila sp. EB88]RRA47260.1 metal-independent alpha-mannosidase [Acidipila sp. EB88]